MPALKPCRDAAEKAQFIKYSEEIILIFSTVHVLPAAVQTASQVSPGWGLGQFRDVLKQDSFEGCDRKGVALNMAEGRVWPGV